MPMRTYARIRSGVVAEVLKTDADITKLFVRCLIWIDVSSVPGLREGWRYDGKVFSAPPNLQIAASSPTIAEIQAQLATLHAKLEGISSKR